MKTANRLERYFLLPDNDPRMKYGDFLSQNEDLQYEEPHVFEKVDDIKIIPNNKVTSLEHQHHERVTDGELDYYKITMQNNAMYDLITAHPHEQKTDVSMTATTAWVTGLDGMNKRILLAQMKAGMPASLMSTARQAGYKPSLEQAAHNQLSVARCLAENDPRIDAENISVFGISRASMAGIGMNAVAEQHDWNVMHSHFIAPCFVDRLNGRDMRKIHTLIAREALALVNMRSIPLPTLRYYANTVDISPAGIRYAINTIGELTSGNAGRLADAMPKDTSAYILGFEGDIMSDIHAYEKRLENHPDTVVDIREKGAHATFLREDIYQETKTRFHNLPEELNLAKQTGQTKLARASIERLAAQ